jgi:hypothetical protein
VVRFEVQTDPPLGELDSKLLERINRKLKNEYPNYEVVVYAENLGYGVIVCGPMRSKLTKVEISSISDFVAGEIKEGK